MKKKINISLVLIAILAGFPLFGQSNNFIDQNYIEVTGQAEMKIKPNLFYLSIIIDEAEQKNKTSLKVQEKNLFDTLKKLKIDIEKDLSINELNSTYKKAILDKNKIRLTKNYQLILRDTQTLATLFPALEKKGISNISVQRVDHSDLQKLMKENRITAIKAAKEKAAYLAEAIGQTIGKALYIREYNNSPIFPVSNLRTSNIRTHYAENTIADEGFPTLDFEEILLTSSVHVNFLLK